MSRGYSAVGIVKICAAAADLVSMFVAGSTTEVEDAIKHLYTTARLEFPGGPLSLKDDLNRMCSDLDLPLIIGAKQKDSGQVL